MKYKWQFVLGSGLFSGIKSLLILSYLLSRFSSLFSALVLILLTARVSADNGCGFKHLKDNDGNNFDTPESYKDVEVNLESFGFPIVNLYQKRKDGDESYLIEDLKNLLKSSPENNILMNLSKAKVFNLTMKQGVGSKKMARSIKKIERIGRKIRDSDSSEESKKQCHGLSIDAHDYYDDGGLIQPINKYITKRRSKQKAKPPKKRHKTTKLRRCRTTKAHRRKTKTPRHRTTKRPHHRRTKIPPYYQTLVPPQHKTLAPSHQQTVVPPRYQTLVPSHQQTEVPPRYQTLVPSHQDAPVPSQYQTLVPSYYDWTTQAPTTTPATKIKYYDSDEGLDSQEEHRFTIPPYHAPSWIYDYIKHKQKNKPLKKIKNRNNHLNIKLHKHKNKHTYGCNNKNLNNNKNKKRNKDKNKHKTIQLKIQKKYKNQYKKIQNMKNKKKYKSHKRYNKNNVDDDEDFGAHAQIL